VVLQDVSEQFNPTPHGAGPTVKSSHMACLGKAFLNKDALNRLQTCSCSYGDLMPTQHTIQPSLSGAADKSMLQYSSQVTSPAGTRECHN